MEKIEFYYDKSRVSAQSFKSQSDSKGWISTQEPEKVKNLVGLSNGSEDVYYIQKQQLTYAKRLLEESNKFTDEELKIIDLSLIFGKDLSQDWYISIIQLFSGIGWVVKEDNCLELLDTLISLRCDLEQEEMDETGSIFGKLQFYLTKVAVDPLKSLKFLAKYQDDKETLAQLGKHGDMFRAILEGLKRNTTKLQDIHANYSLTIPLLEKYLNIQEDLLMKTGYINAKSIPNIIKIVQKRWEKVEPLLTEKEWVQILNKLNDLMSYGLTIDPSLLSILKECSIFHKTPIFYPLIIKQLMIHQKSETHPKGPQAHMPVQQRDSENLTQMRENQQVLNALTIEIKDLQNKVTTLAEERSQEKVKQYHKRLKQLSDHIKDTQPSLEREQTEQRNNKVEHSEQETITHSVSHSSYEPEFAKLRSEFQVPIQQHDTRINEMVNEYKLQKCEIQEFRGELNALREHSRKNQEGLDALAGKFEENTSMSKSTFAKIQGHILDLQESVKKSEKPGEMINQIVKLKSEFEAFKQYTERSNKELSEALEKVGKDLDKKDTPVEYAKTPHEEWRDELQPFNSQTGSLDKESVRFQLNDPPKIPEDQKPVVKVTEYPMRVEEEKTEPPSPVPVYKTEVIKCSSPAPKTPGGTTKLTLKPTRDLSEELKCNSYEIKPEDCQNTEKPLSIVGGRMNGYIELPASYDTDELLFSFAYQNGKFCGQCHKTDYFSWIEYKFQKQLPVEQGNYLMSNHLVIYVESVTPTNMKISFPANLRCPSASGEQFQEVFDQRNIVTEIAEWEGKKGFKIGKGDAMELFLDMLSIDEEECSFILENGGNWIFHSKGCIGRMLKTGKDLISTASAFIPLENNTTLHVGPLSFDVVITDSK